MDGASKRSQGPQPPSVNLVDAREPPSNTATWLSVVANLTEVLKNVSAPRQLAPKDEPTSPDVLLINTRTKEQAEIADMHKRYNALEKEMQDTKRKLEDSMVEHTARKRGTLQIFTSEAGNLLRNPRYTDNPREPTVIDMTSVRWGKALVAAGGKRGDGHSHLPRN